MTEKNIRQKGKKEYSAEEKIRIMLEGLAGGEVRSVAVFHRGRRGDSPVTQAMRAAYYPIGTGRLIELMRAAGVEKVRRLDGVYFQPVIVGTRG